MRRPAQLLWPLLLLSCSAPSGTEAAPAELASISLSPATVSIGVGDSAVFSVTGHLNDGSTSSVTATWSATGGTIANGTYHAGNTAGTYRVIASTSTSSGDFADTAQVTVDSVPVPVTLTSVTVAPQLDTLTPGGTRTFAATGHYSNGSTSAVTVTWGKTGANNTITSGGLFTAGSTLGNFLAIGTHASGKADTATVVIKAAAPTLTSVTIAPAVDTLVPGGTRTFTATGHYSDGSSAAVTATWSKTGANNTITSGGLFTAGATLGSFLVIGNAAGKADTSTVVIKAAPPPTGSDTLLVENFDDSNAGARGWYANTSPTISTTNKHSGAGALEMKWNANTDIPVNGVSLRHLFTSSDRIYLRYWVKYSTNFEGSRLLYHPHEIQFLTDADGQWIGPSATHLTTYVEHNWQNGGVPRLAATDVLNIDQTKIGVDLTNTTENRAVAGCNGDGDPYPTSCYPFGADHYNEKVWLGPTPVFSNNSSSPDYKNNWHKVEVIYQMNSIVGGKGQADGIAQYWFDGRLQIDKQQVLLRTGANATMKFNQILLAFYIGDLSPVQQTVWIDDLIVATGPVP